MKTQRPTIRIMKETVELSEALVLQAREASKITGRSVEEQIEFWVRLGRTAAPFIGPDRALALGNATLEN